MYKDYNDIENMMVNIVDFGEQQMWNSIDSIRSPFDRIKYRKIFWQAKKQLYLFDEGE